jgi:hypothetical protein
MMNSRVRGSLLDEEVVNGDSVSGGCSPVVMSRVDDLPK